MARQTDNVQTRQGPFLARVERDILQRCKEIVKVKRSVISLRLAKYVTLLSVYTSSVATCFYTREKSEQIGMLRTRSLAPDLLITCHLPLLGDSKN